MAHLSISCLGPLQVTLADQPVTDFKSNKVRALLAYLSVEAERPHHREVLAGLIWPDWPDRSALSNLRFALSDLRRVIDDRTAEPPYLLITRDTLQFNAASDHYLDVADFLTNSEPGQIRENCREDLLTIEEAIAEFRGPFLEGFSIKDSASFDEWIQLKRQQIDQQFLAALRYLVAVHEQAGRYEEALSWARKQIEIEPWDEAAHRAAMRILAIRGQRGEALAQFDTCKQLLAEELAVEPAPQTLDLFERIRCGEFQTAAAMEVAPDLPARHIPRFLEEKPPYTETPFFVARQDELARLATLLDHSLAGRGRIAFVTGEAGSGKTSLIQEFSRQSHQQFADLLVASGNCNAYTGIGDPYLPFREILELLTGDVDAKWAAGTITSDHAQRLWDMMPATTQTLVEDGPGLIGTFVQPGSLLERLATIGQTAGQIEVLTRLKVSAESQPGTAPVSITLQQSTLFEQFTRVLQGLAQQRPLLLVIDDLQWGDPGSISLLFHLGRHLRGHRILIVGAYRSEEVALGRNGERHPLEPLIHEFQQDFGDIQVNMDRADRQRFMEALLDSEPNQLSPLFREMLYRQTRGHPLFTIELLRGLQERGDLYRTPDGLWKEGPMLDWETLPARVEAAIAERIGRLAEPLQATLRVACVEGEVFTAEVVARVQAADKREVVGRLSGELDRRHRLIRAQAIGRLGSRRLSRYQFRNYLFQKYLYDSLDEVERAYCHEDVGNALEELHGEQAGDIAVPLAWHFQEAGMAEKAVHYLYLAGKKAVLLCAYQAGIDHLTQGAELLKTLPATPENIQQELDFQLAFGIAWQGAIGARARQVRAAHLRAREICYQTGNTSQLCYVLGGLIEFHYVGAEYQQAVALAKEALDQAQQIDNLLALIFANWYNGFVLFNLGEFESAHHHLKQAIGHYNPQEHHQASVMLRGKDPGLGAMAYDACCLWCLGYPDQARKLSQEALALAREFDHPFTLADVHCFAGCLLTEMQRDGVELKIHAEEMMRLSNEKVPGWSDVGQSYWGEALVFLGEIDEGLLQIQEGIAYKHSVGAYLYSSAPLAVQAFTLARQNRPAEALKTLEQTKSFIDETNERYWEAEFYRYWAEIELIHGGETEAETHYRRAIEIAQSQKARMLELRATTGLARLWHYQGREAKAYEAMSAIIDWFSEGFDTPEFKEAKSLLIELS